MTRTILAIALPFSWLVLGCSAARPHCRAGQLQLESAHDVPAEAELVAAIELLLESHCRCVFPEEIRLRTPVLPDDWWKIRTQPQKFCLGKVRVAAVRIETPDLVAIELARAGKADAEDSYVVFARWLHGAWALSWPAFLGPPLGREVLR